MAEIEEWRTVKEHVHTVSELTKELKIILEDSFPRVWVEGEVSNYKGHTSGHLYFTLKDESSQLRAIVWKDTAARFKFELKDGTAVICFGRLSVYDKQGQYQLYVEKLEPRGLGALQLAFEQLKAKLSKEGLFDPAHKKPVPLLPKRIGIVTSPTGAAIRDILNVLDRRFSNVEVIIYPVKVQGEGAREEISNAIRDLNTFGNIDVMIVGRGGGSLEDLWAFNEEIVARAIYNSNIPVISAVGHEIDWTIADFVADLRAPTPSAAAELVIGRKEDLMMRIDGFNVRLKSALLNKVNLLKKEFESLMSTYVLRHPLNIVQQYQQTIDDLTEELHQVMDYFLKLKIERLKAILGKLDTLSPLAILSRGYSITLKLPGEILIKDAKSVKIGDLVRTRLGKGSFTGKVESIDG
ncbi:MAG: exodeoxyribonuclease VII large subunit [Candidatus Omnitrophica bacterium]|nr:exodeoxyribonuclease VII large subunit [Candidatus Omnitrophota bacterium]